MNFSANVEKITIHQPDVIRYVVVQSYIFTQVSDLSMLCRPCGPFPEKM